MLSRLTRRFLTRFYLCLWVFALFMWARSTGWRTYFIVEDIPVVLLLILVFLFICGLDYLREKQIL